MFRSRIAKVSALTAVVLVSGGIGIASASIPDSFGLIHGCYSKFGGLLTVIDTNKGQTCPRGSKSLNWNQTGPQGPQGLTGQAGASGPQGPAGASYTFYDNESGNITVNPGQIEAASVDCNSGDTATGGGVLQNYGIAGPSPDMTVIQSFPLESSGQAFGWRGDYYNSDSVSHQFVAYVDCAHSTS
jgi:hypothetical protein